MKKQILLLLLSLASLTGFAQTYDTKPVDALPYGSQLYKRANNDIIAGLGSAKFRTLDTKQRVDSIIAVMAANLSTGLATKINNTEKGAINGVATLDASGKVPLSQTNDALLGSVNYQGNYNASTNVPALPAATGNKGKYYVVSTGGTTQGITFVAGDWIISNGTIWQKVDNNNAVTSVAGRTGAVMLSKTDVGLANVDNTSDANKPVSTATQTALNGKLDLVGGNMTGDIIYGAPIGAPTNPAAAPGIVFGKNTDYGKIYFESTSNATGDANLIFESGDDIADFGGPTEGFIFRKYAGVGPVNKELLRLNDTQFKYKTFDIYHTGNLNTANFANTTGTNATGTWPVSVTGNAATATKLATARNINGVAFDGTANITVADNTKLALTGGQVTGQVLFNSQTTNVINQLALSSASSPQLGESAGLTINNRTGLEYDGTYGGLKMYGVNNLYPLIFANSGTPGAGEFARFSGTGNFGINQNNPQEKLDVVGNGKFTGTVTAPNFSGTASNATTWKNWTLDDSAVPTSGLFLMFGRDASNAIMRQYPATAVQTFLGLGSNAYSSTGYLPLTGGTLTGNLSVAGDVNLTNGNLTVGGSGINGGKPILIFNNTNALKKLYLTAGKFGASEEGMHIYNQTDATTPVSFWSDGSATFTGAIQAAPATLSTQLATLGQAGYLKNVTASGTGSTTQITIAHGLTGITASSSAIAQARNAASANIQYVTVDATNIYINYSVAPVSGSSNLSYTIHIKP